MFLLLATALATDHGIQRIYDREVECAYKVDPKPDPATCAVRVRSVPPRRRPRHVGDQRGPPGKLFVSYHMPEIDWGAVRSFRTPRAFEPILLTVGLKPDRACPDELIEFAHLHSERGAVTHQACAGPPGRARAARSSSPTASSRRASGCRSGRTTRSTRPWRQT
ncbi:MAG: hypothetical protein H6734_12525 [Alphaproteobacteria bacterium]|nr:hypothetical protein [Alphaproteobacteria bacterium]